ncbi:hypothetical protein F8388_026276 [Cannabis sativa]|uniref:Large ribosomal subunit protein uL2 RNA-binding domain-containing protein n=1 Tax=Cannabis sativa TaxID=3483 RepID=A0A7J6EZ88_CANSA|nr:hypothetical protein F8388_026276 [Cannabis sativa]KAF4403810.1 hypothetical protein G4B88_014266 [Cannabis sativa]
MNAGDMLNTCKSDGKWCFQWQTARHDNCPYQILILPEGGIITTGHKGACHKRLCRKIDFRRNVKNIYGKIVTIEYNPNRNAYICLIHYGGGDKRYILHPRGALDNTIGEGLLFKTTITKSFLSHSTPQNKTEINPLSVFCQAICGVTPDTALKIRHVGRFTHHVPIEIGSAQGKALAIRWLLGPLLPFHMYMVTIIYVLNVPMM